MNVSSEERRELPSVLPFRSDTCYQDSDFVVKFSCRCVCSVELTHLAVTGLVVLTSASKDMGKNHLKRVFSAILTF